MRNREEPSAKTETVVLLHGLGRSRFSMAVLARFLRQSGFRVINIGYPSRRDPIARHVEHVRAILEKSVTPETTLHFVTHSLGSIILRSFALRHGAQFNLSRAVMLGPPNQGSHTARQVSRIPLLRKFIGPALLELANLKLEAGSDKIEVGIIAGGRGASAKGLSPHLSGDNDAVVSVEETRLEGAKDHMIVRGLHSFLMYQPFVHGQILHFLRNGEFSR